MSIICPTVTATDPVEFDRQTDLITKFAHRIHIDLMDGDFAPTLSPSLEHIWWTAGVEADLHVMYRRPFDYIDSYIKIKPNLVIFHFESDISWDDFLIAKTRLMDAGIKVGIALFPGTETNNASGFIENTDHVLIFSGNLGHHGGVADLNLLRRVMEIRQWSNDTEIGWDGGVSLENAAILAKSGIDVLNAGSCIHHDKNGLSPVEVYDKLMVEISASS